MCCTCPQIAHQAVRWYLRHIVVGMWVGVFSRCRDKNHADPNHWIGLCRFGHTIGSESMRSLGDIWEQRMIWPSAIVSGVLHLKSVFYVVFPVYYLGFDLSLPCSFPFWVDGIVKHQPKWKHDSVRFISIKIELHCGVGSDVEMRNTFSRRP